MFPYLLLGTSVEVQLSVRPEWQLRGKSLPRATRGDGGQASCLRSPRQCSCPGDVAVGYFTTGHRWHHFTTTTSGVKQHLRGPHRVVRRLPVLFPCCPGAMTYLAEQVSLINIHTQTCPHRAGERERAAKVRTETKFWRKCKNTKVLRRKHKGNGHGMDELTGWKDENNKSNQNTVELT